MPIKIIIIPPLTRPGATAGKSRWDSCKVNCWIRVASTFGVYWNGQPHSGNCSGIWRLDHKITQASWVSLRVTQYGVSQQSAPLIVSNCKQPKGALIAHQHSACTAHCINNVLAKMQLTWCLYYEGPAVHLLRVNLLQVPSAYFPGKDEGDLIPTHTHRLVVDYDDGWTLLQDGGLIW